MMLVNNEPGPSVIRSALAMASSVSGSGLTCRGLRAMRRIGTVLRLIKDSPATRFPSARVASRTTFADVDG